MDLLLDTMFNEENLNIWEKAIYDGNDKKIKEHILIKMCDPEYREKLKNKFISRQYKVKPPHEAKIPKDDGSMRTVYVNDAEDRIILTVINNIFFKYCKDMIHPKCQSYQTGIGCGKIVKKVIKEMKHIDFENKFIGYKIDLSKYFDSVPIQYIDQVFDEIEKHFGPSCVLDAVKEYYHDDTLLDINKNEIHKYTSLRQGCAIASFLADSVLYDIDTVMSKQNIVYYRYSDDILIIGNDNAADEAFKIISDMLNEKSLTLNPKKVEHLDRDHWFTFLGFSIKNDQISLSKKRIKNLQKEMQDMILKSKSTDADVLAHKVYDYMYNKTYVPYSYAEGILPVINCKHDMIELDTYIVDLIRAKLTGKTKIGGLGYNKMKQDGVIERGKGRNVKTNREKIPNIKYHTIQFMQKLYLSDKYVYETYCENLIYTKYNQGGHE